MDKSWAKRNFVEIHFSRLLASGHFYSDLGGDKPVL
jgi:hypothetical protein